MWTGPTYDCQDCGACCVKPDSCEGSEYVYLSKDEAKGIKRLGLSVIQVSGDSHLGTRLHAGVGGMAICVAFKGEVGGSCSCSIYQDRPRACRRFEVGSRPCRWSRRAAGLPV
jgi:Fe-S-cluster containining protein